MTAPPHASWPQLPSHAGSFSAQRTERECAVEVLTRALSWLERYAEWFRPQRWEELLPARPFRPGPLLELLALVRVLRRSRALTGGEALARRALDLAEEAVAEDEFATGLRRADALLPYHVNLVGLLGTLGRPQPELHAAAQSLVAAGAGGHHLPYKPVLNRLELRYFLDRGGFTAPPALPTPAELYAQTLAAQCPHVLHLDDDETYALTHVLFYTTDFGATTGPPAAEHHPARLRQCVRTLLGVHLARGSLDLVSELLLCTTALGGAPDPAAASRYAWNTLRTAQRPDGAVPSPVHMPSRWEELRHNRADAYLFGTCYHTTLAAALASAVLLERPRPPQPRTDTATPCPPPPASPDALASWLDDAHPAREPTALQAYLPSVLVLCTRARDAPLLRRALDAAEAAGLAAHPLVGEAAALARCLR
ncbi:DUF6895 family protein [Streptomyces sulphureus]|uniref:DUF6895 family protein n=1 Tax=Streptomyces sulphureus TaxID=47758 RepID=UPI0003658454|nr:hypothetical protein [Streptomyces sulphureus]